MFNELVDSFENAEDARKMRNSYVAAIAWISWRWRPCTSQGIVQRLSCDKPVLQLRICPKSLSKFRVGLLAAGSFALPFDEVGLSNSRPVRAKIEVQSLRIRIVDHVRTAHLAACIYTDERLVNIKNLLNKIARPLVTTRNVEKHLSVHRRCNTCLLRRVRPMLD